MNKFIPFVLLITLITTYNSSYSQNNDELLKAKKYLDKKGEVYFTFNITSPQSIAELTKVISIDNVKNNKVWAYANKKEFANFIEKEIPFKVLNHPGDTPVEMWDGSKGIWQFDTYPTYSQYETMMQTFATNYPNICRLDTIAILPSGHKLLILKITDNPDVDENEPEFLYTGTMHGDETTGYVEFLHLINYLLSNYGSNSRVTNIVNSIETWICPLANPDGTFAAGDNSVTGATRENANFVDLNRNYPDPAAGQHPDGNAWQPETIAWMNFADAHDFVMAANTHGGASVFNYPWDTWTTAQHTPADNSWWIFVGKEFADSAMAYGPVNYFKDVTPTGYTEGADWYFVNGGRQDYMNYFKHCREATIELSTSKTLAANQLLNYWNYLYPSFLNYLEESLYGIRGIITDACTNLPIKANVTVNSHDVDSSNVYSSLPVGNYHRPIIAGTYSLTFSANGYQPQTITGITVSNKSTVVRNVQLSPLAPVASFTADHTSGCNPLIQFTNTSQAPVGSTYLWNFGDGQTSTSMSPSHTYNNSGTYTVTLNINSVCSGSDQAILTNYISITLPSAPVANGAQSCGPNSFTLTATGNGTLNWYDAVTGGNLLFTGSSYHTQTLNNTTTFYVQSTVTTTSASQYVGKFDNAGTGANHTTANYGLYFDVIQDMTLVSVKVFSSQAGNRTIVIKDINNNNIFNQTISIPNGESRVTLNAFIPAGTNYSLLCTTAPNLYRDGGTGAPTLPYPYILSGVVSITGNPANNPAYYYYFYNWEVQTTSTCLSAMVPVTATINAVPNASAGNNQTICYGNSATITATGGTSYLWSNSQTSQTIVDSPINNTVYTVTVTNSEGCSATATSTVFVTPQIIADAGLNQTITINTSTVLNGNATGGNGTYTYHWEPASMLVNANISSPTTINISTATQFVFYVTDINSGCVVNDSVTVDVTTNNSENNLFSNISVYPNPSKGIFNINLPDNQKYNIKIFDSIGNCVYKGISNNKMFICNLHLNTGVYCINISNNNVQETKQIVIIN